MKHQEKITVFPSGDLKLIIDEILMEHSTLVNFTRNELEHFMSMILNMALESIMIRDTIDNITTATIAKYMFNYKLAHKSMETFDIIKRMAVFIRGMGVTEDGYYLHPRIMHFNNSHIVVEYRTTPSLNNVGNMVLFILNDRKPKLINYNDDIIYIGPNTTENKIYQRKLSRLYIDMKMGFNSKDSEEYFGINYRRLQTYFDSCLKIGRPLKFGLIRDIEFDSYGSYDWEVETLVSGLNSWKLRDGVKEVSRRKLTMDDIMTLSSDFLQRFLFMDSSDVTMIYNFIMNNTGDNIHLDESMDKRMTFILNIIKG